LLLAQVVRTLATTTQQARPVPVKLGDPAEAESSNAKFSRKILNKVHLIAWYSISLNAAYRTYRIEHNMLEAIK
jgi:hypothetical protein